MRGALFEAISVRPFAIVEPVGKPCPFSPLVVWPRSAGLRGGLLASCTTLSPGERGD
jgi:hypothetical protein